MSESRCRPIRSRASVAGAVLAFASASACSHTTQYQQEQQAQFYSTILEQQEREKAAQAAPPAATGADAVATQGQQQAALAVGATSPALATPAADAPIARIDGQPVSAGSLAAHQAETDLPRADAFADLVDLTLLRAAATRHGIAAVGPLSAEARLTIERSLADKLGLALPADRASLVVDHAWVKNGLSFDERARQRKTMDHLRARAVAGETIPATFGKFGREVNATDWHIGDHEEYPVDVVPAAARDLATGSVSQVIAGDGGLHLFKIHERRRTPAPADAVHAAVRERLLEGKTIEIFDDSIR